jgi:cellulose synthase/poly-beta-1,6-N-acetylglucosamine synthase-like glycosyltransferase
MGEADALSGLNALAFLLCAVFLSYVTLLLVVYLRHRPPTPGDPDELDWHLFMPCLDEAAVVERFVGAALEQSPTLHLWAIDDHSDDDTLAILERLAATEPRLHVVSRVRPEAQTGKGDALNAAWRQLDRWLPADADRHRVIVGVIDADGQLDVGALAMVAGAGGFADPRVGAVQIAVRIANRSTGDRPAPDRRFGRLLVDLQDLEFVGPIAAMQLVRERTHSVAMGGNGQFTRLSVLDEIASEAGTPWHGALLEDFELGLHVLMAGHETRYVHDVAVQQEGLPDLRRFVRQRSRWAQGSMQCRRYLLPIMRSPNLANRAAFEATYFLLLPWVQLVGLFVYLGAYVVLASYLLSAPGGWRGVWVSGQWGVVPLLILTGIGPFAIWGPLYRHRAEPSITRRRALLLGVANWAYSNLHYVATWWAFSRVVWARSDWKKTERVGSTPAASSASSGRSAHEGAAS